MSRKPDKEEQTKRQVIWLLWLHDYLEKYYNNEVSIKESQIIESWNPDMLTDQAEPSESRMKNDIDMAWKELSGRLGFESTQKGKGKVRRPKRIISYAAAAIILCMASVTAYQYNTYNSLQSLNYLFSESMVYATGNNDVKDFTLPDGSSITLNGNTTIAFVKNEFNDKKREVWLQEGEVFFDVVKNPAKKFIIHSRNADVTVRGTSFSVTSYNNLNKSNIAVRTGVVEVTKDNTLLGMLTPAQNLVIDKKTGKVKISEVRTSNIAAWKERQLIFNHADGDEVLLRMKQHFDIKINAKSGLLDDINFSASFKKDTNVKNVLSVLAEIYGIKYSITNNTVTLSK